MWQKLDLARRFAGLVIITVVVASLMQTYYTRMLLCSLIIALCSHEYRIVTGLVELPSLAAAKAASSAAAAAAATTAAATTAATAFGGASFAPPLSPSLSSSSRLFRVLHETRVVGGWPLYHVLHIAAAVGICVAAHWSYEALFLALALVVAVRCAPEFLL